jgi:uroporphyrinogen-III synthase
MTPLIILRPEPGAGASAERARRMGLEVITLPLFEIRPLPWTAPDPGGYSAILMTSANAARFVGPELARLRDLPVHAVGEATAEAARAADFHVASVGTGGTGGLSLPQGKLLLHLCGWHRRPVEGTLQIAVYESVELPAPEGISGFAKAVVAVHSPRAGRRLAELADERSQTSIAAISEAAAEACGAGWERVEVADSPRDSALLALAARLCKNSGE